jgi:hypothetical protein
MASAMALAVMLPRSNRQAQETSRSSASAPVARLPQSA